MSRMTTATFAVAAIVTIAATAGAQATRPTFDEKLARSVGADSRGMRNDVLVILETGPTRPSTTSGTGRRR